MISGARRLARDGGGGVAVYVAVFIIAGIGGAGLAIDFGRLAVLKAQLQDGADARALAAAVQLDGRDGSIDRARAVATNAITQHSSFSKSGLLAAASINFYASVEPGLVATGRDDEAQFVEVVMRPEEVNLLFRPLLSLISGEGAGSSLAVAAAATATPQPFICQAPPVMLCDPAETDPGLDLRAPGNAGRQLRLKQPQSGGASWAPGNFGLLSVADGASGAAAIAGELAAVTPAACHERDVTTATGSKTNMIRDAVNARFDMADNDWPNPAPNVIDYPRDIEMGDATATIGSGAWDIDGYWHDKHGGAAPAAVAGASRYQVYLYELGEVYGRRHRETFYPVTAAMPNDFSTVTPPQAEIPVAADGADRDDPAFDGVPDQAVAANGPARRLLKVAQLQCIGDDIHGHGSYPTNGNYIEVFITESVKAPPNAAIYGEVVRSLSAGNEPSFHANVRLVR